MIPGGFRKGDLRLQHLPFSPQDLVEPAAPWVQGPPEFIVHTQESDAAPWSPPTVPSTLHATYGTTREDVVLFGPNHLVDERGGWTLEAEARPEQYVAFYNLPAYRHILKGAKPTVGRTAEDDGFTINFEAVADEDVIHLDRPVFLATPIEPDNWGRWLSTVVPKVWQYTARGKPARDPILCRCSKPWQKHLLHFLGADPGRVIDHDPGRTYVCSHVETATYSAADLTPSAAEMEIYRAIAQRCRANTAATGTRIFVSRAGRSARAPNYRVLTNEAALIAAIAGLGFEVIEPETLPFEEQVVRFSSAEFVVGLGGAGMFNALFCAPGTRLVTIESGPTFIGGHARLFAAASLRYGVVFGLPDETDPAPIHKRWSVDVAKTIDAIKGMQ